MSLSFKFVLSQCCALQNQIMIFLFVPYLRKKKIWLHHSIRNQIYKNHCYLCHIFWLPNICSRLLINPTFNDFLWRFRSGTGVNYVYVYRFATRHCYFTCWCRSVIDFKFHWKNPVIIVTETPPSVPGDRQMFVINLWLQWRLQTVGIFSKSFSVASRASLTRR